MQREYHSPLGLRRILMDGGQLDSSGFGRRGIGIGNTGGIGIGRGVDEDGSEDDEGEPGLLDMARESTRRGYRRLGNRGTGV
jgi:hypothetical protein